MITRCRNCPGQIRDCSTAPGWYHTATGHEKCASGAGLAEPVPMVAVLCKAHRKPLPGCRACLTAAEVMLFFHNAHRCIPKLCGWMHVRLGRVSS